MLHDFCPRACVTNHVGRGATSAKSSPHCSRCVSMDVDLLNEDPIDDVEEGGVEFSEKLRAELAEQMPYRCESLAEFEGRVQHAVSRVCDAMVLGDWGCGFAQWTETLRCLLSLKYPFSRALRAHMARLYYEVAVMPTLDIYVTDLAATMCIELLRPKKQISAADLTLPWRPLYEALHREVYHKQRKISTSNVSGVLMDLAESAQRFYPAEEAHAMLETILPEMDGADLNSVIAAQALVVHFVPLASPHAWLPVLFRLWETFRSSLFDDQMLDLLARLAELHVGEAAGQAVWQETGIFTDAQFAIVMSKCLRSAGLPMGSSKAANATLMAQASSVRTGADATASTTALRMKKPTDRLQSFARVLVYSMADDGDAMLVGGSKALTALSKFVQATETYFHPSNWGLWQVQLANFVQHLTWEFARRCKAEERADCATPAAWRLTLAIRREFVLTLRTVCLLSMFSKEPITTLASQSSLKRMAFLHPELILPPVLERSFSSLEALETTQRTTAVISTLAALSQALVSPGVYAAGPKHLAPLLYLCLPGIDLNDPMKTLSTCMLILSVSLSVYVADGTSAGDDGDAGATLVPLDDANVSSRGAEDYAARLSTAEMDVWSGELVQRVLALFAALPEEGKSGRIGEKNEEMVLNMLIATCDAFCSALGEEAFERCLDIVLDYCRTTVAANGVKVIGSFIGCFARANSARVLERVVPMCCERIALELAHGASSVRTTSTSVPLPQDAALHWHVSILSGSVMFAGAALLPYRDELLGTLELLTRSCLSERGYMLTAKLVQRVLSALSAVYPAEQRCVNPSEWGSEAMRLHPHRFWGRTYAVHEVDIAWHTPSDGEIDMALAVLDRVAAPALDVLEARLGETQRDKAWHNDVCRYLLLVRFALSGQLSLAERQGEAAAAPDPFVSDYGDTAAAMRPPPLALRAGYALAPDDVRYARVQRFRARAGDVLLRAAAEVPASSEDYVDAVKQVVRALRAYLVPQGTLQDDMQGLVRSVTFFHTIGRRWARQATYPRIMWVRRALLYHTMRQRLGSVFARPTPRDEVLIAHLVQLCMSHYVAVRRLAQNTLESVCLAYDGTRARCLDALLNALAPGVGDERVKGALYVLGTKAFVRTAARHPRFTPRVLLALLHMQHHPRPSVQQLVRTVLAELIAKIEDPAALAVYVPSAALAAMAEQGRSADAALDVVRPVRQAFLALVADAADRLDAEVLALAEAPTTHWAFAIAAVRALRQLQRRGVPPSAAAAGLYARAAIADNPGMRSHAQLALIRMLYVTKLRSLSSGTALLLENATHPLKRRERLDTRTLEARAAAYAEPLTPASRLHDKTVEGWLAWGADDVYYEAPREAVAWEAASMPALDAVRAHVATDAWWTRFAGHLALEMDRDYLAADTATLVKSLFQMLGAPLLDAARPVIERLVAERDRHKHRAAAEMVGGLLRGAKHWPLPEQDALWAWLAPFLERVLVDCTLDSQSAWHMCVEYVCSARDPRRTRPLVRFLFAHAQAVLVDARQSPLQQAHAQTLLASAVHSLQHKAAAWGVDELADAYVAHFAHDYQEVRKAVGDALVELELAEARPAYASVDALLAAARAGGAGSLVAHSARVAARCAALSEQLQSTRAKRVPSAHGTSAYDRAASTGALWVSLSLDDHRLGPMTTHVLALLPDLFEAFQLRDNEELSETAHDVLVQIASHPFGAAHAGALVRALLAIVRESTSWHSRLDALPLLQVAYFQKYVAAPRHLTQSLLPRRRCDARSARRAACAAARSAPRGARDGRDDARRRRAVLAARAHPAAPRRVCRHGRDVAAEARHAGL